MQYCRLQGDDRITVLIMYCAVHLEHTGIPGTLGLGPQLPRRASDDDVPTWLPLQGLSWGKRGQKNTEYSGLTEVGRVGGMERLIGR